MQRTKLIMQRKINRDDKAVRALKYMEIKVEVDCSVKKVCFQCQVPHCLRRKNETLKQCN